MGVRKVAKMCMLGLGGIITQLATHFLLLFIYKQTWGIDG